MSPKSLHMKLAQITEIGTGTTFVGFHGKHHWELVGEGGLVGSLNPIFPNLSFT